MARMFSAKQNPRVSPENTALRIMSVSLVLASLLHVNMPNSNRR